MIRTDEDSLVCDLAETYHIYDYRQLPATRVAVFSIGLRDDSRIKMKLRGDKYPLGVLLQALTVDKLSYLLWSKTEDATKGQNRPPSIYEQLMGIKKESDIVSFSSPEDFERERKELIERYRRETG